MVKKKNDEDLDEICVGLLRRTKPTSKIMVAIPKGRGLVVSVHSEIRRAIKGYAKRRLKDIERRLEKQERKLRKLEEVKR